MATVPMIITQAGIAEIINAEATGTAPVKLARVGIGTGQYQATPEQTALKAEFKSIETIAGGATSDNQIHVSVYDTGTDTYTVHEVGVYTENGTLFAVSSELAPIIEKASSSHMMFTIDLFFTNLNPDSIVVGDTNFLLNYASTEMAGVIELATEAEVLAGEDEIRAVTPATLHRKTATTGRVGLIRIATQAEVEAGKLDTVALTPLNLMSAFARNHGESGFQRFPGGLILQWGRAKVAPDGSTHIIFPVAFPNMALDARPVSVGDIAVSFSVYDLTKEAVSFKHNADGAIMAEWLALGV